MSRQSKMRRKRQARIANTLRRKSETDIRARRMAERRQRGQWRSLQNSLASLAAEVRKDPPENAQAEAFLASLTKEPVPSSPTTLHVPKKPDLTPARKKRSGRGRT